MEDKKTNTSVIEVVKSYTNSFGREIKPEFPFSIIRVDNSYADKLIKMGVAKMLNPDGTCIHSEMRKREREMKQAAKLKGNVD